MNPSALAPEDLQRLRPFVRALVADESTADDILQETWLTASQRMPAGLGRPSALAWARQTAQRLVWSRGRRRSNRALRETELVDPAASAPDPSDELERIELLKHALEALGELPDPDRRALTLRYLQGLPSRQVAARLGIAEGAARQRVHRAMARLRAALDARHNGRRAAWAAPLTALVAGKAAGIGAGPKLAAAAAVFAAIGLSVRSGGEAGAPAGPEPTPLAQASALSLVEQAKEPSAAPALPGPTRTAAATPNDPAPTPPPAMPPGGVLLTLIEADTESPIPDTRVRWYFSGAVGESVVGEAQTDALGRFALPREAHSAWTLFMVVENETLGLQKPWWGSYTKIDALFADSFVRLPAAEPLEGRVLDAAGRPLSGVRIAAAGLRPKANGIPHWALQSDGWWTESDARGRFRLNVTHRIRGVELSRGDLGTLELQRTRPAQGEGPPGPWTCANGALLTSEPTGGLTLHWPQVQPLRARVLDAQGAPIPNARIGIPNRFRRIDVMGAAHTDAQGIAWVAPPEPGAGRVAFHVSAEGYRARLIDPEDLGTLDSVVLQHGAPLVVRVRLADGSLDPHAWVELIECEGPYDLGSPGGVPSAVTGPDGQVQFPGALDAPFELYVESEHNGTFHRRYESLPGEPIEVVLPNATRLIGRVRDLDTRREVHDLQTHVRRIGSGEQAFRLWGVGRSAERLPVLAHGLEGDAAFEVRVEAQGYRPAVLGPFENDLGTQEVDVWLEPVSTVAGQLVNSAGQPVVDADVTLVHGAVDLLFDGVEASNRTWLNTVRTDAEGRFAFEPPGGPAALLTCSDEGVGLATWGAFESEGRRLVRRPLGSLQLGRGSSRGSSAGTHLAIHIEVRAPGFGEPDARLRFRGSWHRTGGVRFAVPVGPATLVWTSGIELANPTGERRFPGAGSAGTPAYLQQPAGHALSSVEPPTDVAGRMLGSAGRLELEISAQGTTHIAWPN